MELKRFSIFICLIFSGIFWSCQNKGQADIKQQGASVPKGVVSVQGTVLREAADEKSKFLTFLSWGEEIEVLEKSADEGKFTKIRLISDGSEGWVKSYLVKNDAVAGVIATEVESYQRPDPMSLVLQKLAPSTLVLVLETKGDWLKIDGNKPVKDGWVKNKAVSTTKVDVLAGKFLAKANAFVEEGKKEEAVKALEKIETDYNQSKFLRMAQDELAKLNPSKIQVTAPEKIVQEKMPETAEGQKEIESE